MKLKNNETRNMQFFYSREVDGKSELQYVHIPGGATVELDDAVFKAICASKTEVSVMEEVITPLNEDTIGAEVKSGKEALVIKDYYDTGKTRVVNLMQEAIKRGELTVVERPGVTEAQIDAFLKAKKVDISAMTAEEKLVMYDKLA